MPQQCPKCAKENPDGFKFCGYCGAEIAAPRTPQAERREVTVLFADMKGFTAMSEQMAPDVVREIMNECFKGLGRCVKVEEGHVNKYSGDCVMAQFGAPVAHEDDPARACRAALAMQQFLAKYAEKIRKEHGVEIKLRIGVHCGLVAAGGIGAEDVHEVYDILGDTVNLAQRLEASAEPGSILVSEQVVNRTRGQFEFGDEKELTVKGKSEPVSASPVIRVLTDVDPRGRDNLSVEMVGRKGEMERLLTLWNDTTENSYRISIRGDMGLGKTRLVEEAVPRRPDSDHLRVTATTITQRQPFGLAKRLLRAAVSFVTGESRVPPDYDAFVDVLNGIGSDLSVYAEALWYLAAPDELNVPAPEPDSETMRSLVEHGLVRFAEALAARWDDVCVVVDSYELADRESRQLIEGLAAPRQEHFVQFIFTVRPEAAQAAASTVDVPPLNDVESAQLLDALLRGAVLPDSIRATILDRANGVPLYIEEMVRSLRETGGIKEQSPGEWAYAGTDTEDIALPPSLRAAMLARIDRLSADTRELLRIASVQGMEVDLDIAGRLMADAGTTADAMAGAVRQLQDERLFQRGDDAARVTFTSRLLRDTCCDTLTGKDRSELHRKTAEKLVERAGTPEQVDAVQLATHFEEAECPAEAARAYLRAGHRAANLYLNDEAETFFGKVLELTDSMRNEPDILGLRHDAVLRLARILVTTGEYESGRSLAASVLNEQPSAAVEAEAFRLTALADVHTGKLEDAEEKLSKARGRVGPGVDTRDTFVRVLLDLAEVYARSGRQDEAVATVHEAREASCERHGCLNRIRCDMLEGKILHAQGKFTQAREKYETAHSAAQESGTFSERARSTNSLGNVARDIGEYDDAVNHFRKALELWQRTGDAEGQAGIYNNLGNIAMSRGEFAQARKRQEQALELFDRIGNVQGAAMALANLAILCIEENKPRDAVAQARRAIEKLGDAGQWMRCLINLIAGDGELAAGDLDAAEKTYTETATACADNPNPLALAGANRGLGRIAVARGNTEEGLELITRALDAYRELERAQEIARTQLYQAEALIRLDRKAEGLTCLREAEAAFEELGARNDAARARQAIEDMNPSL